MGIETAAIDVRRLPGTSVDYVVRGQGYFPVITAFEEEEILVILRGGAGHIGIKGRLDAVRSSDGGETWEPPVTVADSERDDRNPALGVTPDGTVIVAYHWQGSYDAQGKWAPHAGPVDTRVVYSPDRGRSWEGDCLLNFTPINGASPFGKIRCSDGTLYMPIYGGPLLEQLEPGVRVGDKKCPSYLLRSRDQGQTWGEPLLVAQGLNEADLLLLPDGSWLFAARSEDEKQAIYSCRSTDQGTTWGDLQRVTVAREHPPDLTLLGNGYVLLTFGCRYQPYGVQGLLSQDGGRSWESRRLILTDDLPGWDIGYPSTVRLPGGRLITVFYSAGTRDQPPDPLQAVNAFCQAVCYDELTLLEAWGV